MNDSYRFFYLIIVKYIFSLGAYGIYEDVLYFRLEGKFRYIYNSWNYISIFFDFNRIELEISKRKMFGSIENYLKIK